MKRAVFAACALLAAASVGGDQSAFGDYHADRPGARHHVTVADLPAPYATGSASNSPGTVPRPAAAMPQAMPGYTVSLYADALENPRLMRTAPNGDIFVAESRPGRIKVLRGRDAVDQPFDGEPLPLGANGQSLHGQAGERRHQRVDDLPGRRIH